MNELWIRALVLILMFAAIVLVVERVVGSVLVRQSSGRARNMRLEAIARGATRAQTMGFLRRDVGTLREGLPDILARPAVKLEKMLLMAGTTIPTQRLLWMLAIAPLLLFAGLSLTLVVL
ncbi:MAG: hypothetical protein M3Q15_07565, partial [Pseudomonadota bacterium]|nr:hypothetical protein [Pseudomonadota bacterium]